jgi:lipid-binding SYLF domain-containing protein
MRELHKKLFTTFLAGAFVVAGLALAPASKAKAKDDDTKDNDRIENAGTVFSEIVDIPDDIPQDLLDKARCVIIYPSVVKGGSVGFQIGGQATDFVILVMNNRGADSVLHSKVKLGGDASVAAGPKGRSASAETDATLRAEMLSYSRSRGAFAGISLEGSTVRPDNDANKRVYGKTISAEDIITESRLHAPASAAKLIARLQKASPHLKP